MIFFFKSDGTLIKSAPETVYQGSEEAGKVYVVAPLNANMLVDVYYELPNGERWGAYLLENNGTVINNEELPDSWALWSTTLESAITQYAGTLKAQFGFYQSGTADKVPLITSQGVTITIAKGVVRDLPSVPTSDVYAQIVNSISSIKQDIANLPNEYLSNTNEDKIALKNNGAIEYSENATAGTIVKRDSNGKINVADGTEDLNAVNIRQFNAALAGKVDASSVSATAVKDTIAQRTATGQLKAVDGVTDDDLATVKQLNAVKQGNYSDITNIDLNTGDTTVEYDTELGIKVNAKGTLTHKNGSTEQPTTKFELPIISGAGVSIDKKEAEEKIEIKSLNSNLENGTANVLIQTTDTNHSFKVMTDGRAKVQSAPVEDDDVVRKYELYTKFDKTNIVQATGDSTTDVMSQKAVTYELNKTNNSLADLKEALYGYVLGTTEIETESAIPYTVEVGGTTYNLVDNIRGLVKEIKGGTVKSENLLPYPYEETTITRNGITFTDNGDGTITANGTSSSYSSFLFNRNFNFIAGNTYYVSTQYSVIAYKDGDTTKFIQGNKSFTWGSNWELVSIYMQINEGIAVNNLKIYPMINLGDTALPYKPYFDGLKSVEYTGLEVKGKNLFDESLVKKSSDIINGSILEIGSNYFIVQGNISASPGTGLYPNGWFRPLYNYNSPNNLYLKAGDIITISADYTVLENNSVSGSPANIYIYGPKNLTKEMSAFPSVGVKTRRSITYTIPDGGDGYYYLVFTLNSSKIKIENIQVELGDTATAYKPYREPTNILPFTTTLRGVDTYKDRIIITKNESDDYYTATKETNCEEVAYTRGDEDNAEYITDLTTTVKPLATPTTEVLSTTLTESDVMPLLELGGSVEIVNENSLYVTGSTAIEMVYKLINNTTTSEVTE